MSARNRLPRLSLNQWLGLAAFVLGAIAIFASPQRGNVVTLDARELALIVEGKLDHVSADQLADWIIQGRADYRLIDVRERADYAEYHIPTAESASVATLPDYPLARNETVVLYSDGGIHAAQAWFLLKAKGFKAVYTVWGGLDAWKDEILFPVLGDAVTPEQRAELERRKRVSQHFGGQPRAEGHIAADPSVAAVALPKLDPNEARPVVQRTKRKKKGC